MFWIVLILSALVIAAWGFVAIGPEGLSIGGNPWDTSIVPVKSEYKFLFASIIIDWWLTWGVLILAIISTASIFPDFLSGGSVDLFIAKPISRLRLFLTKYFAGMLFAFLQLAIFSIGAFFIVGIRGKMWEPRLFLAIPIVLCMFSYLYAIGVLLGVLTRSTIATLLLTILCWGIIAGVDFGEVRLLALNNVFQRRVETIDQELAELDHSPPPGVAGDGSPLKSLATMLGVHTSPALSPERQRLETRRASAVSWVSFSERWHRMIYPVQVLLPKTNETANLLDDALLSSDEFMDILAGNRQTFQQHFRGQVRDTDVFDIPEELDTIRRSRSTTFIISSSLAFEFCTLAAWRRVDFHAAGISKRKIFLREHGHLCPNARISRIRS